MKNFHSSAKAWSPFQRKALPEHEETDSCAVFQWTEAHALWKQTTLYFTKRKMCNHSVEFECTHLNG